MDATDTRERKRPDLPFGRGVVFPSETVQEEFKDLPCKFCDSSDYGLPSLVNIRCELYWEHVHVVSKSRSVCTRYGHGYKIREGTDSSPRSRPG